jgi:hypothetical protein
MDLRERIASLMSRVRPELAELVAMTEALFLQRYAAIRS